MSTIRADLQSVKKQLANDKAALDAELVAFKGKVREMGESLAVCTDDVVDLKNIRIVGIPEDTVTNTTTVAALLKVAFRLGKVPLLDRVHRTSQLRPKHGERPCIIITKFHYYSKCADVLRCARENRQVVVGEIKISVYPDYIAKVARARAAFTEVRRQLRGMEGVR